MKIHRGWGALLIALMVAFVLAATWRSGQAQEPAEAESVAQMLSNLDQVNYFFRPGPPHEPGLYSFDEGVAPDSPRGILPPAGDLGDVYAILKNPRVVWLLYELQQLPPEEAAVLLNEHLAKSLEAYEQAFAKDPQVNSKEFSKEAIALRIKMKPGAGITGPGWAVQTPNPEERTFLGTRYKVLSLVWLAGALELTGTCTNVRRAVEVAVRQRDRLYGDEKTCEFFRGQVLRRASLYNRIILVKGLVGTTPRRQDLGHLIHRKGLQKKSVRLTSSGVVLMPDDPPVKPFVVLPDYTRDGVTVEFYSNMRDGDFDDLNRTQ